MKRPWSTARKLVVFNPWAEWTWDLGEWGQVDDLQEGGTGTKPDHPGWRLILLQVTETL